MASSSSNEPALSERMVVTEFEVLPLLLAPCPSDRRSSQLRDFSRGDEGVAADSSSALLQVSAVSCRLVCQPFLKQMERLELRQVGVEIERESVERWEEGRSIPGELIQEESDSLASPAVNQNNIQCSMTKRRQESWLVSTVDRK